MRCLRSHHRCYAIRLNAEFVLLNAMYFKALWMVEFNPESTREQPFFRMNGTTSVKMMTAKPGTWFRGMETAGMKVVYIPYQMNRMEFVAFMPTTGDLTALEQHLTTEWLQDVLESLSHGDNRCPDTLVLPNFVTRTRHEDLLHVLDMMGMTSLGKEDYEFFRTSFTVQWTDPNPRIIQESRLNVHGGSTEAASSTAVIGGGIDGGIF